jgi:general secretion pathway protein G
MTAEVGRNRRNGFTLIELLLVVGILGVLAAIVVTKTAGQAEKAKRQATWAQADLLKTAIAQFEMDVGRWPTDLKELVVEGDEKWPGPFLDSPEVPKDGWGNEYHFELRGKFVRVTSPGPDGKLGTEDDLWK